MLFRRVIEHVKAQNWIAIALEFGIVVIGVFVGMQVSNWNDTRAGYEREKILLMRLHSDFDRIIQWGDRHMPAVTALPSDTSRLIEAIRADIEPEMNGKFHASARASVEAFAPFELSPTYEELVATGTLSRITNPDIRAALSAYGRARESELLVVNRQLEIRDTGKMEQAIQFRTHDEDYNETFVPVSFDWDALKKTESHLQVGLRNQLLGRIWKQNTVASARDVFSLIEVELCINTNDAIVEPVPCPSPRH